MKTFLFVQLRNVNGEPLIKCKVYEGKLTMKQIVEHIHPEEIFVNVEYACTCTF